MTSLDKWIGVVEDCFERRAVWAETAEAAAQRFAARWCRRNGYQRPSVGEDGSSAEDAGQWPWFVENDVSVEGWTFWQDTVCRKGNRDKNSSDEGIHIYVRLAP